MSTHRETGEIEGPFPTDDPVFRLIEFYLANGYRIVERQKEPSDAQSSEDDTAPLTGATVERGRAGAGWWTSNMTELHTSVVIERHDELMRVSYTVDTSGQLLNEAEQAFWSREIRSAQRFARGDADEPRDLRKEEERRAENQKDELMSIGLWGAIGVFTLIVVLAFLGII
ncbi:hypothetical protein FIV42_24460 [Persicimonas caeni]|uniref:Uncharacterized protein n=1 Tax=Persicimonas caeni TaxID=2292766 RepID=A0A4Y6Q023_PERCE|nr:hypothetical protein [Persicimonas caeni]QDG53779.1 hypothetical protein FIV42_24460 [Persicimonas caeni]QED35000.1 hypothetical protein FRD00_24455 [Persicimonas caeni]